MNPEMLPVFAIAIGVTLVGIFLVYTGILIGLEIKAPSRIERIRRMQKQAEAEIAQIVGNCHRAVKEMNKEVNQED